MSYSSEILGDSPTAYWKLDESSGTTANDEIGSHDGTYNGSPSLGENKIADGTSVDFDGSDDYISVSSSSDFDLETNVGALEGWGIIPDTFGPTLVPFFRGDSEDNWHIRINSAAIQFRLTINGSADNYSVNHNLNGGDIIHFVINNPVGGASNDIEIWVNGVELDTFGIDYPLTDTGDLWINRSHNFYGTGTLDELAIYPDTLTQTEIESHYTEGTLQVEDLLGFDIVTNSFSFSNNHVIELNDFDVSESIKNIQPHSFGSLGNITKSLVQSNILPILVSDINGFDLTFQTNTFSNFQLANLQSLGVGHTLNTFENLSSETIGNLILSLSSNSIDNDQLATIEALGIGSSLISLNVYQLVNLLSFDMDSSIFDVDSEQAIEINSLTIDSVINVLNNNQSKLLDAISTSLSGSNLVGSRLALIESIALDALSSSLTYELALREVTIPTVDLTSVLQNLDTNEVIEILPLIITLSINSFDNKQVQDIVGADIAISSNEVSNIQAGTLLALLVTQTLNTLGNSRGINIQNIIYNYDISDIANSRINDLRALDFQYNINELVNARSVELNRVLSNLVTQNVVNKRYASIGSVEITLSIIDYFLRLFAYEEDRTAYVNGRDRLEVVETLDRVEKIQNEDRIIVVEMKDRESNGSI